VRLRRLGESRSDVREHVEQTLASGVHPLFLVEEEYRLAVLDAEIAFVERFIDRITDPDTGWAQPWAAFHDAAHPAPNERPAS
jgi:hypothetical protein